MLKKCYHLKLSLTTPVSSVVLEVFLRKNSCSVSYRNSVTVRWLAVHFGCTQVERPRTLAAVKWGHGNIPAVYLLFSVLSFDSTVFIYTFSKPLPFVSSLKIATYLRWTCRRAFGSCDWRLFAEMPALSQRTKTFEGLNELLTFFPTWRFVEDQSFWLSVQWHEPPMMLVWGC